MSAAGNVTAPTVVYVTAILEYVLVTEMSTRDMTAVPSVVPMDDAALTAEVAESKYHFGYSKY